MYSRRALLLIYVILGVSSYLGVSPIRFDISSKRFYSTKWSLVFCRLTTILSIVQILFSTYCLYSFPKLSKPNEIFTFNMIYIVTMCQIIAIICFLLLSIRGDAIARIMTQVLRHAKFIESTWCSFTTLEEFRAYPTQLILETFFCLCLFTGIAASFVTSSAIVLHEILPNNWISLISKKYWNGPMIWANRLTEAYLITISSTGVATVCSVITFQLGKGIAVRF